MVGGGWWAMGVGAQCMRCVVWCGVVTRTLPHLRERMVRELFTLVAPYGSSDPWLAVHGLSQLHHPKRVAAAGRVDLVRHAVRDGILPELVLVGGGEW